MEANTSGYDGPALSLNYKVSLFMTGGIGVCVMLVCLLTRFGVVMPSV